MSDTSVSEQSEHAFWNDPTISDAPIFVTANYVWGVDEAHHGQHRYLISAYMRERSLETDEMNYYLDDRYMAVRKYDEDSQTVLTSEKPEILARLRRVKAAAKPQPKPH